MPDDYELSFWEEIWGCVKVIGIPYDTVMSMPVQNRKILIQRHNMEGEMNEMKKMRGNDGTTIGGESLNAYAEQEMKKIENRTQNL